MGAEGMILAAGGLAFAGSFKESGGFPENGYAIMGGTVGLVFLAATVKNSAIATPVKWLAILMLLGAAMRYLPVIVPSSGRKGKANG
jgi:hypothetical protein